MLKDLRLFSAWVFVSILITIFDLVGAELFPEALPQSPGHENMMLAFAVVVLIELGTPSSVKRETGEG